MILKQINGQLREVSGGGGGSSSNSINAKKETSPATAAHSAGDYIYYNNIIYIVKSGIAIGDNLVINANIEEPVLPDDTVVYIPGLGINANSVAYDNTSSGLTANNVQAAIDEIAQGGGGSGGSNPNLLINGWFTVNQRGASQYVNNYYSVDRWIAYANLEAVSNTVVVTSSGVTLNNGANTNLSFRQKMENIANLVGETLTLSAKIDGVIYSTTFTLSSSTDLEDEVTTGVYLCCKYSSSYMGIKSTVANSSHDIRAVKLELGSQSTLALDTAPDYTTELLKCQRYFRRIGSVTNNGVVAMAFSSTATNGYALIPLSVPMRTLPTVTVSGNYSFGTYAFTYYTVTVSANSASDYRDRLLLNLVGTNLPTNTSGILVSGASSYIDLSAEL